MCRDGVNLTHFKLALHQLTEAVELSQKGIAQWQNVLTSTSFKELNQLLNEAESLLGESASRLETALKKASELAVSGIDEVEITPI